MSGDTTSGAPQLCAFVNRKPSAGRLIWRLGRISGLAIVRPYWGRGLGGNQIKTAVPQEVGEPCSGASRNTTYAFFVEAALLGTTAVAMAQPTPQQQQQHQDAAGTLGRLALHFMHICASSRPAGASICWRNPQGGNRCKAAAAAAARQQPQQDAGSLLGSWRLVLAGRHGSPARRAEQQRCVATLLRAQLFLMAPVHPAELW